MGFNENMLIGYARVSTIDQNPNLQTDALTVAGCQKIFIDKISGTTAQSEYCGETEPPVAEQTEPLRRDVIW